MTVPVLNGTERTGQTKEQRRSQKERVGQDLQKPQGKKQKKKPAFAKRGNKRESPITWTGGEALTKSS